MFNKKLINDFNDLVRGLKQSHVLEDDKDLFFHTDSFASITGRYGENILTKVERLEKRVDKQQETIELLFAHLKLEKYTPPCETKLRKKP